MLVKFLVHSPQSKHENFRFDVNCLVLPRIGDSLDVSVQVSEDTGDFEDAGTLTTRKQLSLTVRNIHWCINCSDLPVGNTVGEVKDVYAICEMISPDMSINIQKLIEQARRLRIEGDVQTSDLT